MIEAAFGLIGVIVGSVIIILKDILTARAERGRSAAYAAIRIVCLLEEYADRCVDVVADDGTSEGRPAGQTEQGQEYYEAQVNQPEVPKFPEEIDWRSLDEDLMPRILELPNIARITDRHISSAGENVGPPDYGEFFEARQNGYANLGIEALEIAERLEHDRIMLKHILSL